MSRNKKDNKKNNNFKKLPNYKKVKYWFDIGVPIITFITVLITFLTLKEIKTQRLKAYEPEIRILSSDFNLIGRIDNVNFSYVKNRTVWFNLVSYNNKLDSSILKYPIDIRTRKQLKFWEVFNPDESNMFQLPIINIGQGAALDIKIKFHVDTSMFLDLFNKYSDIFSNFDTIYYNSEYKSFIYIYENDTNYFRDYIDNSNIQFVQKSDTYSNDIKIKLPDSYYNLIALWHNFIYHNNILTNYNSGIEDLDKKSYRPDQPPPIYIDIQYYDINEKLYERNFKCQYDPPHVSGMTANKIDMHGEMKISYIKCK